MMIYGLKFHNDPASSDYVPLALQIKGKIEGNGEHLF